MDRKHNYVVRFEGSNQVVYGKDIVGNLASYTQPITILQAIRQLKTLGSGAKAIYKLVKVDPKKEKLKRKIQKKKRPK